MMVRQSMNGTVGDRLGEDAHRWSTKYFASGVKGCHRMMLRGRLPILFVYSSEDACERER